MRFLTQTFRNVFIVRVGKRYVRLWRSQRSRTVVWGGWRWDGSWKTAAGAGATPTLVQKCKFFMHFTSVLRKQFAAKDMFLREANGYKRALALRNARLFIIPTNRAQCIQKLCRSSRDVKETKISGWRSLTIRVRFRLGFSSTELERCFCGGHLLWINCNCKNQLIDWRQRSSTVLVIVLVLG